MLMRRVLLPLLLTALLVELAGCGGAGVPVGSRYDDFVAREGDVAPFDSAAVNFLIVGDWGRNGFFNQSDVARAMGRTGSEIQSRFTISTGDNFYVSGVASTSDPKWDRSFEDIYTAPSLQSRWYVTLGNHDWQGQVQAQLDYTRQSDRWYLPDRYYAETLSVDDTTEALFVFLDTSPLTYSEAQRRKYDPSIPWTPDRQLAWLESTLAASDAEWKLVIGHHPIYVGSVSYINNPILIESLVPILERHGVQAYFAGHDHNLQHHRPKDSTVDYFISGAGSLTREVAQTPSTLFALRTPGFMAVSLTATRMDIRALDENNTLVYATAVPQRRGRRLPLPFGLGESASASAEAP